MEHFPYRRYHFRERESQATRKATLSRWHMLQKNLSGESDTRVLARCKCPGYCVEFALQVFTPWGFLPVWILQRLIPFLYTVNQPNSSFQNDKILLGIQ
ncbi:hypothetical protein LIPSTDRAFT_70887 [Lipomyces starkeyi NRRL Y-11557]|uniref:Uncharacterized protein n=1 Tax=Lipomyces starkeyi NRRL Y-11557 TaxID=675824 RepID=A0A1E3Q805_LIPST|nr:hypothetical protein LIPSTDRAFT_70887 [Lipomyces starkeyi NRRL Y-11557]